MMNFFNKSKLTILPLIFLLFLNCASAAPINDTFHINLQTTYPNGTIQSGTFNFAFNITDNSSTTCSPNLVYNNSASLTTDSNGIVSLYLPQIGNGGGNLSSLNYDTQYYLCYYRDGTLQGVDQLGRVPYSFRATQVNLSEVNINTNLTLGNYNLTANNVTANTGFFSFLGNFANAVTSLFVGSINATGNISTQGNVSANWIFGNINASYIQNAPWLLAGNWNATNTSYYLASNPNSYYNSTTIPSFVNGSGTQWYIPAWNGTNTLNNSNIYFNGTSIGIGTTFPNQTLDIVGKLYASGNFKFNDTNGSIVIGTNAGNTLIDVTALGNYAAFLNTANNIVAIGYQAGFNNSGLSSTAVGLGALSFNSGSSSVGLGYQSGELNQGSSLTAIGTVSGFNNIGNYSIFIGFNSGHNNSGNDVVAIGYNAGLNNVLSNQFIVQDTNVNSIPLIQGNFSSGYITFASLVNLTVITLPACDSTTNGTIGRNGTGVWGCQSSGTWKMLF